MNDNEAKRIAVSAEVLYLVNLMFFPGLAFLVLLAFAFHHRAADSALVRCHLKQTLRGSIWAGVLLCGLATLIIQLGGLHSPYTWMVLILYVITCHAMFILFGVLGLARALAQQTFVYPVVGSKQW
jgi:uncharacterized membrane protein